MASALISGHWVSGLAYAPFVAKTVVRAKKCLDFTGSIQFWHFLFCVFFGAGGAREGGCVNWFGTAVVTTILGTLVAEYICMSWELKEISLSTYRPSRDPPSIPTMVGNTIEKIDKWSNSLTPNVINNKNARMKGSTNKEFRNGQYGRVNDRIELDESWGLEEHLPDTPTSSIAGYLPNSKESGSLAPGENDERKMSDMEKGNVGVPHSSSASPGRRRN